MTQFNKAILVTGGAGFIGSNLVHRLIKKHHQQIRVVDKLTYAGNKINLEPVQNSSYFEFIQADIVDQLKMEILLKELNPWAVINLAAETHVDRSIDSPHPFLQTNVVGTFHLLEAVRAYLKEFGEKGKVKFRFLHVSTDEVFGTLGSKGRFTEKSPYQPYSPYSASKAAADHLVHSYYATYHIPTLITNCSNNYGPYQFPEKMIPLMILNAMEGKKLPIYGDGKNVRDWIYVEDHCEGIWRVLARGTPGETYNLGANEEHTNLELVQMLCECLEEIAPAKKNSALVSQNIPRYDQLIEFVQDRPGHDRRYAIDAGKARRALGWTPRHQLKHALKKTVRWYLQNRSWCEVVQRNNYNRDRLGLMHS